VPLGNAPDDHAVIKKIRAAVDARYPDRMLLAEANLSPEEASQYFGQGDECHMAFHFPLMPRSAGGGGPPSDHRAADGFSRADPAKGRYGPLDVDHEPDTEMAS
jgi:hypothetical protein